MKTSLLAPVVTAISGRRTLLFLRPKLLAGLIALAPFSAFAQGNDNPTGVTGVFNGNSSTGCSYDPYTANATRTIPDLTVAGAVGAYPLQWARIMNSRAAGGGVFGQGGGWSHSYQWSCSATENVTNAPDSYTVNYPDGRVVTFDANIGTPYLSPAGVTDRFGGAGGNGYVYLNLTDGGKVRFYQTAKYWPPVGGDPAYYSFTMGPADQIIDPHGNITTLTYDTSGKLIMVKEAAGRYLNISYGTNGYVSEVDTYTAAGHWTQWVQYAYATQSFGGVNYVLLTGATYIGTPVPTASYTYQTSNVSSAGNPLISTCRDVRYPGPMKNIAYTFVRTSPLSYGQLSQEQNVNGTFVTQLTVSGSTRTEKRGDGTNAVRGAGNPTRTFTFGATAGGVTKNYLLKTITDFKGQTTTLGYDADGFVNSKTTNGHTTSFTYLNSGYPTGVISKVTHPGDASTIQYFYTDGTGAYLDHVTDELGRTTFYKRNTGTLTTYEIDYPDGGIEKYTYNAYGQVLTHTMPSNTATNGMGGTETYAYSDPVHPGQVTSYTPPATSSDGNPGAHPTQYAYDINDRLSTVTDPRGNVTTLYHNEVGQTTIVQHPGDHQIQDTYGYNADETLAFQKVQLTATSWAQTDYTYDDYKRPVTITDPIGNITTFYYDAAGGTAAGLGHTDANVTRLKLPSTKLTQTLYDENLQKCQVSVGFGSTDAAVTTYTYDAAGNLKTRVDPNGQPGQINAGATWTNNYDVRERLLNVTDPLAADRNSNGHTVDYAYDVANNKLTETRANNQVITYNTYDAMNRLTKMTVQQAPTADAVTTYTWSNSGKLLSMVDPMVHTYTYAYDQLNRLVTTTYPLINGVHPTESYLYDIAGNRSQFTNRNGNIQTFTYDSRNRETRYDWNDAGVTPWRVQVYDDASRVTSCNSAGSNINFTYFDDGALASQEEWTGYFGDNTHRTLAYTYKPDGNRASVSLSGLIAFNYDYTGRNQLSTVTQTGNNFVYATYGYDPNGNMTSRELLNGLTSSFAYDAVNRLTDITHPFTSGGKTFHYTYDAAGNRLSALRNAGPADSFAYDKGNQLTSFTPGGGTASSFSFDAAGNRTSVDGTSYSINNGNGYTLVGGRAATYDNNGNVLTRYDASGTQWTYTYDAMNRLTYASSGATWMGFFYDGLNRQVARSAPAVPATFSVWDGWDLYAEYGFQAAVGSPLRTTIHGAPGDLVTQTKTGVSTTYYYPDGLGSTAYLASGAQAVLEQYTYDAYGTPTIYNASGTVIGASAYAADYLYTGRQWHSAIGLYDLRNRFYTPHWGRFLQPDPIGFAGDPANIYRYCANNPVNASDPSGLAANQKLDGSPSDDKPPPYYPVDPNAPDGTWQGSDAGQGWGMNVSPNGSPPESFTGYAGVNFYTGGAPTGVGRGSHRAGPLDPQTSTLVGAAIGKIRGAVPRYVPLTPQASTDPQAVANALQNAYNNGHINYGQTNDFTGPENYMIHPPGSPDILINPDVNIPFTQFENSLAHEATHLIEPPGLSRFAAERAAWDTQYSFARALGLAAQRLPDNQLRALYHIPPGG